MTEISAPWAGVALGDAALAPYTDQEWAVIWRDLIRASKADSGPLLGSGVSPDPGLTIQATTPASAAVNVTAGSALVRGTWYNTDATVILAIAANGSGNPRIDTIVAQKNYAAQTIRLAVHQGTPAVSPVAPTLTQTDGVTWEVPLGDVAVASGFATIVAGNIKVRRHWANLADAVYLHDVLNNSGVLLETGDVVVWDTTADRAVKTSIVVGDGNIAGAWQGRTAAGGYGRVLVHGIGFVNVNGAVAARGSVLIPSGTARLASVASSAATASKRNAIGTSLAITTGAGLCLAIVDVGMQRDSAIVANTSLNTGTVTGAWAQSHATHTITITPHTTRVKVTVQFAGYMGGADTGYFDIYSVTLTARAGTANEGLNQLINDTVRHPVTVVGIFTGLTPGVAQEFQLYMKTLGASSINSAWPVHFYAEEI
jgi:hypothetical protein